MLIDISIRSFNKYSIFWTGSSLDFVEDLILGFYFLGAIFCNHVYVCWGTEEYCVKGILFWNSFKIMNWTYWKIFQHKNFRQQKVISKRPVSMFSGYLCYYHDVPWSRKSRSQLYQGLLHECINQQIWGRTIKYCEDLRNELTDFETKHSDINLLNLLNYTIKSNANWSLDAIHETSLNQNRQNVLHLLWKYVQ